MKEKPCIMAVDDDEKALHVLEALLVQHGYEVFLARNGQEAITAMASTRPGVVIMDIFMPQMDGYAALGEIKNNAATRNVPVIMVGAVGEELSRKLAELMGAAGYVTKPFKSAELLEVVSNLLPAS